VVEVNCSYDYVGGQAQIDCSTTFLQAYNTISWATTGGASPASAAGGAKSFTTFAPISSNITVQATVCLGATCTISNTAFVATSAAPPPPQVSQMQMALTSSYCGAQEFPGPTSIYVSLLSWNPGDPLPTGIVSLSINGISQGSTSVDSGEPSAVFSVNLADDVEFWQFFMQYSGDSNWLASSAACSAENVYWGD
jgi:hypothetical protein